MLLFVTFEFMVHVFRFLWIGRMSKDGIGAVVVNDHGLAIVNRVGYMNWH